MRFPDVLTGYNAPSQKVSGGSSVNWDYSGPDEARKRRDAIADAAGQKYEQLYGGDIAGSVASGQKIRRLLASLAELPGVRMDSASSHVSSDLDGPSFSGRDSNALPSTSPATGNSPVPVAPRPVNAGVSKARAMNQRRNLANFADNTQDFSGVV